MEVTQRITKEFTQQISLKKFIEKLGCVKEDLNIYYDPEGREVTYTDDEGEEHQEIWHSSGFEIAGKTGFISHNIPVGDMDAEAWDKAVEEDKFMVSWVVEGQIREGESNVRKYFYIHKKPFSKLKLMTRRD